MKTKRWTAVILCLSVLAMGVMNLSGCGTKVQAANLMEGIAAKPVSGKAADDAFKNSSADFAIRLFQQTRDDNKNSLISPPSRASICARVSPFAPFAVMESASITDSGEIRLFLLPFRVC